MVCPNCGIEVEETNYCSGCGAPIKARVKELVKSGIRKWYLQTWLICILILFWYLVIPLLAVIILIILQNVELKKMYKDTNKIIDAQQYADRTRENADRYQEQAQSSIETAQRNVELKKEEMIQAVRVSMQEYQRKVEKECEQIRSEADGYQKSVWTRCGEIKEEADTYCERIKTEADDYRNNVFMVCAQMKEEATQECHRLEKETKGKIDIIRAKWRELRIFTEEHLRGINLITENTLQKIDGMENGHDFEYFFADILRECGFEEVSVTKGSGDMGADVIACRSGIRIAIQCKRYRNLVDTAAVQQALSGTNFYGCHVGIVVTNQRFTTGAVSLAQNTGIVLWDRVQLKQLIFEYAKNQYIQQYGTEAIAAEF